MNKALAKEGFESSIIERYSPNGSASAEERVEDLVQTLKAAFPGKLQDL